MRYGVVATFASLFGTTMSLKAGTRLGPYEIIALIGAGGMGEVFKAHDSRLGREVAVKLLPPRFSEDLDRLRRFEKEARSTGQLNHPNIVAIHDVGTHDHCPYIVTELLDGENLRDRMGDKALPWKKAVEFAWQIARGLAAAHAKNIIHRDLKPENIYITRDGRVKLLDFGLAKLLDNGESSDSFNPPISATDSTVTLETKPGSLLGTMGYMSPEQVQGNPADHRSDIFSFGAMLYEMVAGKRAFKRESNIETMSAILKEDPFEAAPIDAKAPSEIERIVRRCLEKSPEERFQSASDLAFALDAIGEGSTITTALGKAGVRGRRGVGISTRRALLAGAGVGLASAAGGFWIGASRKSLALPVFTRLTYRRGTITAARFAADSTAIVYSASWEGKPSELFYTRINSHESRPLGLGNAFLLDLAHSDAGDMAILQLPHFVRPGIYEGTMAFSNIAGGAPRPRLPNIQWADWGEDDQTQAVVTFSGTGLSQLEFPIQKVVFETSGWLSHPRIDPTGRSIAVIEHPAYGDDRGSIVVVDRSGKAKTLSTGWSSAQGLAWRGDGAEVWFTASDTGNSRSLYAVDMQGRRRLVLRGTTSLTIQDMTKDGRVLVVSEILRARVMVKTSDSDQETELSWLDASHVNDITQDGKSVLIAEVGEGGGPRYTGYLRRIDGEPAMKLGEGLATGLSADGKYVLSILQGGKPSLSVVPTGSGQAYDLRVPSIVEFHWADWFASGRKIFFSANQAGEGPRIFVYDLEKGGDPTPISPSGVGVYAKGSPDEKWVAVNGRDHKLTLYSVDGKTHKRFDLGEDLFPIQWSRDGKSLYVAQLKALSAEIKKIDVDSPAEVVDFKVIRPYDVAGVVSIGPIVLTPDAKTYAYTYHRRLTDLYVMDGLE